MNAQTTSLPWYRYSIMWLVVSLPIGAVLAGIVTFVLILRHPDPVIPHDENPAVARAHPSNSVVPPTD
jgi:hypothetical protein